MTDVQERYTVHTKQEYDQENILLECDLYHSKEIYLNNVIDQIQNANEQSKQRKCEKAYKNWNAMHPPINLKNKSDFDKLRRMKDKEYINYLQYRNKMRGNVFLNATSFEDYNPYRMGKKHHNEAFEYFGKSRISSSYLCRQDTNLDFWSKIHELSIDSDTRLRRQNTLVKSRSNDHR